MLRLSCDLPVSAGDIPEINLSAPAGIVRSGVSYSDKTNVIFTTGSSILLTCSIAPSLG